MRYSQWDCGKVADTPLSASTVLAERFDICALRRLDWTHWRQRDLLLFRCLFDVDENVHSTQNTHTHTHSPLYKNAFLVRLFTDVYQHHTVCTASSAAECQWQQTRLPLDCKCESSAFTPVTSRHLLLMWSAWMSVCVHKNSKAWTTVKFTLYCHCTTIKHGYR